MEAQGCNSPSCKHCESTFVSKHVFGWTTAEHSERTRNTPPKPPES